ncbi:MAG: hypothetical protein HFE63_09440 [Clostridiales bacterium]|nr:hypothetical protein [Clostridiales bacterium]
MNKRSFILIFAILILSILTSCSGQNADSFDAAIAELECTQSMKYVKIESLSELLETAKPNLIICGSVLSRGNPTIIDHSEEYSDDYLKSTATADKKQLCAAAFLSTPYTIEINEVLLGDTSAGTTIEIDAPYGIIDEYFRRDGLHPILKIGQEYLFFLRTDYMYGDQIYYLAFDPVSALELNVDGTFSGEYSDYIDGVFGDYSNSIVRLLDDLQRLISENDYDLTMESFASAAKKVKQ